MNQTMLSGAAGPNRAVGQTPPGLDKPKIMPLLRGPLIAGLVISIAFFGGFGGWAATAPLSSGAIAAGVVSPDSSRKVIQHLEGGVVRIIHVKEGQQVHAGDPLITLESTRQEANYSSGQEQYLRMLMVRARLDAYLNDATELVIPPELSGEQNANLAAFMDNQQRLFETQRLARQQQSSITDRKIDQLNSEIAALEAQNGGMEEQRALLQSDIKNKAKLFEQQLISSDTLNSLRRQLYAAQSDTAANNASIARAQQAIEEAKLALLQNAESFRAQLGQQLSDTNNEIAIMEQDIQSRGDILRRTVIKSPVDGVVLNLRSETTGGVVRPGEPIMDVVPLNDDMIIVARLAPKDIDLVSVGLKAHVVLVPFANRNLLPLNGEVIQVGADSSRDEITGQYFYELRVRVPGTELSKHEGLFMSPGMPADVTVVTGARTMLQYIAEPLLRAIRNAFVYD